MATNDYDLRIANAALNLLAIPPIPGFDNKSRAGKMADARYTVLRDSELSKNLLAFNKTQKALTLVERLDRSRNSWGFQFALEDDMLTSGPRAVVRPGGLLNRDEVPFDIINNLVHANLEAVDAIYPRRVDASVFSPVFVRVLELVCAVDWCLALTESESKLASLSARLEAERQDMLVNEDKSFPTGGFTENPLYDQRQYGHPFGNDPLLGY